MLEREVTEAKFTLGDTLCSGINEKDLLACPIRRLHRSSVDNFRGSQH